MRIKYFVDDSYIIENHQEEMTKEKNYIDMLESVTKEKHAKYESEKLSKHLELRKRIEIESMQDYPNEEKLHSLRVELTIINKALLYYIEKLPHTELAKMYNESV